MGRDMIMSPDGAPKILSHGNISYERSERSIFELVENPTIAMYDGEYDSRDLKTFFYDRLIKMMNPLTGSLNYQEEIALVRGKLQTLFGDPNNRGDDYKNSFEYNIKATIDGVEMSVPLDPANRHYAEILHQVDAGDLTIQDAD